MFATHSRRILSLCHPKQLILQHISGISLVSDATNQNTEIIFYDLETTGLNPRQKQKGIEILQLGAISDTLGETFQQYILPTTPIPYRATNVHGLFLKKKEGSCSELDWTSLYIKYNGGSRKVDAVDKVTGLKRFIAWLETFQSGVTLAGYNSHNYDDWVLCHGLQGVVDRADLHIHRLADVAKIVRPILRQKLQTRKWNLGFAVTHLLERRQSQAHGALSDAEDARDLLANIASSNNMTTKNVLGDRENACRDFEDVWEFCFNMIYDVNELDSQPLDYLERSLYSYSSQINQNH